MSKWILWFVVSLVFVAKACGEVKVEKIEYEGWHNCYRVSNGEVELVLTGDVGPRVIRFGFMGGQNLFKEFVDPLGGSNEEKFQLRGGDCVWKAPEDPVATWAPDNMPVKISVTPNGLIATAPVEPLTRLQKEIAVRMLEIETLGPLTTILPSETAEQLEQWSLHRGVDMTEITDQSLDAAILPLPGHNAARIEGNPNSGSSLPRDH